MNQLLVRVRDLVEARLYEDETQVIQDALRHLLSDRPDLRISVAVHRYRADEELSLDQAAAIAGVSLERMKEILEHYDVPLRLEPASIGEARAEYATIAARPIAVETDADGLVRMSGARLALDAVVRVELEERYGFRDPGVRCFLQAHPHLTGFLLEAFPYLEKYFGLSPCIELEILRDPEIGATGQLIARILTPLSVDKAQARLDGLDDEWLLDELDRVDGLLNFNLEFI